MKSSIVLNDPVMVYETTKKGKKMILELKD